METIGKLLTCDRCGETLFIKKKKELELDGGFSRRDVYESYDCNWRAESCYPEFIDPTEAARLPNLIQQGLEVNFLYKMLCPKCRSGYSEVMKKFWNISTKQAN